jgi:hypothetical protein
MLTTEALSDSSACLDPSSENGLGGIGLFKNGFSILLDVGPLKKVSARMLDCYWTSARL